MNLSDLTVDGLTQLEVRLTADLEMVKRVKSLLLEYQKMGVQSPGVTQGMLQGVLPTAVVSRPAFSDPGSPQGQKSPFEQVSDRLEVALSATPPSGFVLDDLSRATYRPNAHIGKDTIKSWVKGMIRKGKIQVLESRSGRNGSIYAAVRTGASEPKV